MCAYFLMISLLAGIVKANLSFQGRQHRCFHGILVPSHLFWLSQWLPHIGHCLFEYGSSSPLPTEFPLDIKGVNSILVSKIACNLTLLPNCNPSILPTVIHPSKSHPSTILTVVSLLFIVPCVEHPSDSFILFYLHLEFCHTVSKRYGWFCMCK